MIKSIRIIRGKESKEDYSWARKLTDSERAACATNLICELWRTARGVDFPRMDRGKTEIRRPSRFQPASQTFSG